MSYPKLGVAAVATATTTTTTIPTTAVDCQKQVRSWRLLRAVMELLIPTCNCTFIQGQEREIKKQQNPHPPNYKNYFDNYPSSPSTMIGTIFGHRKGKISFCIQNTSRSTNPILLLELAVPTSVLAKEMQGGVLRIVLECDEDAKKHQNIPLLSMPWWNMYCNGKKVGHAIKRRPTKDDTEALSVLGSVVAGAGVVNGKEVDCKEDDQLMYLRANFRRVSGSGDSESFHLIDPAGKIGQELSIYFFRSQVT